MNIDGFVIDAIVNSPKELLISVISSSCAIMFYDKFIIKHKLKIRPTFEEVDHQLEDVLTKRFDTFGDQLTSMKTHIDDLIAEVSNLREIMISDGKIDPQYAAIRRNSV